MAAKRASSLAELLVVIAIILVLAVLLFPVFSRAKAQAKLTDCQSRLHQVAFGMQMYRSDNDGQAWLKWDQWSSGGGEYTTAGRPRYPWDDWLPAAPYLKDKNLVWCPLPERDLTGVSIHNLYILRSLQPPEVATTGTTTVWYPLDPEPGRVAAFCYNHTIDELEKPNPILSSEIDLWKGIYPFVREDGSTSIAKSSQIELWYLWKDGTWHPGEQGTLVSSQVWRFPSEPWPPSVPWS